MSGVTRALHQPRTTALAEPDIGQPATSPMMTVYSGVCPGMEEMEIQAKRGGFS